MLYKRTVSFSHERKTTDVDCDGWFFLSDLIFLFLSDLFYLKKKTVQLHAYYRISIFIFFWLNQLKNSINFLIKIYLESTLDIHFLLI